MAAEWPALTEPERSAAVEAASREGRRAARWFLAEAADGRPAPLRHSRWAGKQGGLEQTSDRAVHRLAVVQTMPVEHDYVDHVIDRCCPERAWWWGGSEPEELRRDPRVCAFCDAYERERHTILGIEPLPAGLADLQLYLWEMKEQERASARAWYDATDQSYSTPDHAASRRGAARWECRLCQFATDVAEMALEAAIYRGGAVPAFSPRKHEGGEIAKSGSDRQPG